jgi:NADPH:quinone reductase-like Zn-dependent oxidoreductase
LAERIVVHENGLVHMPPGYSFEEAACLPCAGVTAWNALMVAGRPIAPGARVLVLGTGGVSMWALQLGVAAGAEVLVTSSSDAKLERAAALGATHGINYRTTPDWDQEVLRLTEGQGVDCIIEVGGAGTLARSFRALAPGGKICLIGVLAGPSGDLRPETLMLKRGMLIGIMVGDRDLFEQLNRAVVQNRIKPVIDRVFPFEQARDAFAHQASGDFMGKIVIRI